MKRYPLLLLFLLTVITARSQNHGTVKALVLDSINNQPIGYATIAVLKLKDSSLLSYTITDKNGAFTLYNLNQAEPNRLLISCVGYNSARFTVELKKGDAVTDLGKVLLSHKTLEEVTIKGERVPVVIKKDTIEFNAEAFKVRPNAIVEDLLKKLPGMQVSHDGKITVNGKEVSRLKVDGKDFFANDPKIATRNLDADMISKVQVYDDREGDPDHLKPDYEVKKIINLKFKKALKKSIFGRGMLGGGTRDRYQANTFLNKFQDDLQLSANANSNNLSGTGVFGDGFQTPILSGDPRGSVQRQTNGTINFNDKFGKQLKLNLIYYFNNDIDDSKGTVNRQQFVGDTTFNTFSNNINHHGSTSQTLSGRLEYGSDTATSIKYNPEFSYNSNNNVSSTNATGSNNFVPLLSQSINNSNSSGSSVSFRHEFTYYTRLSKKGASFSISHALSISPSHNLNFSSDQLLSYTAALQSDTLNRSAKNTNNRDDGNLGIAVHYPFTKKLSVTVSVSGNFNRDEGDLFTYQQNLQTGLYTIFLPDQSNNLTRKQWKQALHPELMYQFTDKISLKAGVTGQLQQVTNHFNSYTSDLDQHFNNLFPTAELHINKVNINYSEDLHQPSINDLQPITVVYSQLFSFIGNPDLKPTHMHNFGVNYFDFKTQSQLYFNFSSRVSVETNSVVRERTINAEGAEVTTPINRNGRFTTYLYAGAGKTFKKSGDWQISTNTNLNGSYGHNFFEVNNQDGYQNTVAITLAQEISANWKDIIELRPGYSISPAITKYQLVDYKSSSYITHRANLGADFHLPKKISFSTKPGPA